MANGNQQPRLCQVVDLMSTRTCNALSNYPIKATFSHGGMIGDVPVICGGWFRSYTSECYAHDVSHDAWKLLARMTTERARHASVVVGEALWLTGGRAYKPSLTVLASTEYVFLNGTVVQGPVLPLPLHEHSMVKLADNRIMIIGDNVKSQKVLVYDPKTNVFSEGPTLLEKRRNAACTLFQSAKHDGRPVVLAAGGYDGRTAEILDYSKENATWERSMH